MGSNYGKLTVYFENPFWVGVFERIENGKLSVCKVTFGSEPKDYEVWEFVAVMGPSGDENELAEIRQHKLGFVIQDFMLPNWFILRTINCRYIQKVDILKKYNDKAYYRNLVFYNLLKQKIRQYLS